MAKSSGGSRKARVASIPADVVAAAGDVVRSAQQTSAPVTRKAAKELRDLGRQLDAARAIEAKRLAQLAQAEASKGGKQVAKRGRQAAAATADVAALVARIGERSLAAMGSAAGVLANTAMDV